jgi:hypothetical protein
MRRRAPVASVVRWTKEAVKCYELGANCAVCSINKLYFQEPGRRCMMNFSMRELIRVLGMPPRYMLSEEFKRKNWLI